MEPSPPIKPPATPAPRFKLSIYAWIGWGGFFVGLGAVALFRFVDTVRDARATAQMRESPTATEKLRAEQRAAAAQGKSIDAQTAREFVRETSEKFEDIAQQGTRQQRATAEAVQAFMSQMLQAKERYDRAAAPFVGGKSWQLDGLNTKEAIAQRRQAVAALAAANQELWDLQDNDATVLRRELEQRNVPREFLAKTVAAYQRDGSSPQGRVMEKIRAGQEKLIALRREFADFAEANLDRWHEGAQPGTPNFDDGAAAARFEELMARVRSIVAELNASQKLLAPPK